MTNSENETVFPTEQDLFQTHIAETNKGLKEDQSPVLLGNTIESCFTRFAEIHRPTFEHCKRVGSYANRFGLALGLTDDARYTLWLGSRLHDIGKIADVLLLDSPNAFTDQQRDFFESTQHAQVGHELLQDMGFPDRVSEAVRDHHVSHYSQTDTITNVLRICDRFDYIVGGRLEMGIQPGSPEIAVTRLRLQFGSQLDPQYEDLFTRLGKSSFI